MLEGYLVQTCRIVTVGRNLFGDSIIASSVAENCRFRNIPTIRRTTNQEVNDTDALVHLAPNSSITKDKYILFDGVYYQPERIIYARKLGSDTIEFIKVEVKVTDIMIS